MTILCMKPAIYCVRFPTPPPYWVGVKGEACEAYSSQIALRRGASVFPVS